MALPDVSQDLNYGAQKEFHLIQSYEREWAFTRRYQETEGLHPYLREARCLQVQVPAMLTPIQAGDWFAGRVDRLAVGVDPERGDTIECGYYIQVGQLNAQLERLPAGDPRREDIQGLLEFWQDRQTYPHCRQAFSSRVQQALPSDGYYTDCQVAFPAYGMGGPCLDFDKLVRLGIDGLRAEVTERLTGAPDANETAFLTALHTALDLFSQAALRYAVEAETLMGQAADAAALRRCAWMAGSLRHIAYHAPQNYHQAIQLFWLYSIIALVRNYGRLDVTLGDLLVRDLESGALTEAEALEMTVGLWRMIAARGDYFNNRILVGGRGRRNTANADRFALLSMEAQQIVREPIPQLSLRWHTGMNPLLWEKAMNLIGAGCTFPILYNDDVNVGGVARAFDVTEAEAEQYMMYGCGEYVLEHRSIGAPDGLFNVAKALDITLHNGVDPFDGQRRGLALGSLADFASFEALQAAFTRQLDYFIAAQAEAQATIYRVTGQAVAYPYLSLLYDDCIARARPLLAGGARYLGGITEVFGSSTTADALLAIKVAVFEKKLLTAEQLLVALAANFAGYEREHRLLRALPKYGNDHPEADAMSLWLNQTLGELCRRQREHTHLDSYLMVLINNGDSVLLGKTTAATADGRRRGEPLSNGNQPSAGADHNGVTALLNSMAKLNPGVHAGVVHNLKLSRQIFTRHPSQAGALVQGYFAEGGTQLMITVTDRQELEQAMLHPEQYANLVVRVGGYSERFINLPREIQLELIQRTFYE